MIVTDSLIILADLKGETHAFSKGGRYLGPVALEASRDLTPHVLAVVDPTNLGELVLVSAHTGEGLIVDLAHPERLRRIALQPGASDIAVADGMWLVAAAVVHDPTMSPAVRCTAGVPEQVIAVGFEGEADERPSTTGLMATWVDERAVWASPWPFALYLGTEDQETTSLSYVPGPLSRTEPHPGGARPFVDRIAPGPLGSLWVVVVEVTDAASDLRDAFRTTVELVDLDRDAVVARQVLAGVWSMTRDGRWLTKFDGRRTAPRLQLYAIDVRSRAVSGPAPEQALARKWIEPLRALVEQGDPNSSTAGASHPVR